MKLRNLVFTAAGAALVAAPVAAQAVPVRAATPVAGEENLAGGGVLIPLLVFAAVSALFAFVLFDSDDEPVSP